MVLLDLLATLEQEKKALYQARVEEESARVREEIAIAWETWVPAFLRELFILEVQPIPRLLENWTEGEPVLEDRQVYLRLKEMPEVKLRVTEWCRDYLRFTALLEGEYGIWRQEVIHFAPETEEETLRYLALRLKPVLQRAQARRRSTALVEEERQRREQEKAEKERRRQEVAAWWASVRDDVLRAFRARRKEVLVSLKERRKQDAWESWPEPAILRLYRLSWAAGVDEGGEPHLVHWWVTSPEPDAEGWFVALEGGNERRVRVTSPNGYSLEEYIFDAIDRVPFELREWRHYQAYIPPVSLPEGPYTLQDLECHLELSLEERNALRYGEDVELPPLQVLKPNVRKYLLREE